MKTSKTYELYNQLKETLNSEQQKVLVKLDDEYMKCQVDSYDKGVKEGKKQSLKTIIELIMMRYKNV